MLQDLSSAAFMIGALRVKQFLMFTSLLSILRKGTDLDDTLLPIHSHY